MSIKMFACKWLSLFIVVKNCKNSKCLLTVEEKKRYIYKTEYYFAKQNKLLINGISRIHLKMMLIQNSNINDYCVIIFRSSHIQIIHR